MFWTMSLWVPVSVDSSVPGRGFESLGQNLCVACVRVLGNKEGEQVNEVKYLNQIFNDHNLRIFPRGGFCAWVFT